MSHRSDPFGLHGLRKQVTEAKEQPSELRRREARIHVPGGRTGGKAQACFRQSICWQKKGVRKGVDLLKKKHRLGPPS